MTILSSRVNYFTHHSAKMRCYSTVLLLEKTKAVIHKKYYYKLKG